MLQVVPIHTEHPGRYEHHFRNVQRLRDGEVLAL